MIPKLFPKTWTSPAGRVLKPEDVDTALDRLAILELEVAKLIKAYGELEGTKSPDYHG